MRQANEEVPVVKAKRKTFVAHDSQIQIKARKSNFLNNDDDTQALNEDLEGVTDHLKKPILKLTVLPKPLKLKASQKYKGKFLVAEKNVTPKEIKDYVKDHLSENIAANELVFEDQEDYMEEQGVMVRRLLHTFYEKPRLMHLSRALQFQKGKQPSIYEAHKALLHLQFNVGPAQDVLNGGEQESDFL